MDKNLPGKDLEVSWILCENFYFDSEFQNILEEIGFVSYIYIYIQTMVW